VSCILYADTEDFYIEKEISTEPLPAMHHHRSYELYYLVRGEREYFIEDRFYMVREGDLVFIPREVFHRTDGDGGLRFLVHFTDGFLRKYFTDAALQPLLQRLPTVFRGTPRDQDAVFALLETLLGAYSGAGQALNEPFLSGQLYQLLFAVSYGTNTYVSPSGSDERITEIIRYINENYSHITDISQIAAHFYISKYHLCRLFTKHLGITLVSYLNTIKIREACAMLRSGCGNMTQIALQCGFNSSSYFCKIFKKERGISPSEYRKQHH